MSNIKSPFVAFAIAAISWGLFFAIGGYLIYKKELNRIQGATYNISHANALLTKNIFSNLDSIITNIANDYFYQKSLTINEAELLLSNYKKSNKLIHRIGLLDSNGQIVAWSEKSEILKLNDREYFLYHKNSNNSTFYLSSPIKARTDGISWVLVLSRAIRSNSGELLGIGIVGIDIAELERVFEVSSENSEIASLLVHKNGKIILRTPKIDEFINKDASKELFLSNEKSYTTIVKKALDGKERFSAVHRLDEYELLVSASIPIDEWLFMIKEMVVGFVIVWLLFFVIGLILTFKYSKQQKMQKLLENKNQSLQSLLNRAQEIANFGAYSWDLKTNSILWSDQVYKMFCLDKSFNPTFEKFLELIHEDDRERVKFKLDEILKTHKKYQIYYRVITKEGIKIFHSLGELTLENNKPVRLDGVVHDVTELKKIQDELRELNLELEKRIKEEINKRLEQEKLLIQSYRVAAMGDTIRLLAHHWRQPLSVLMFDLELIENECLQNEFDPKEISQKIEHAKEMLLSLSQTINRFDSFFKTPQNSVSFELIKSINKSVNFFKNSSKREIDININSDGEYHINGMANDFEYIILQLLINAEDAFLARKIENPKVLIDISKTENEIKITISDNGGGIDPSHINRVFEPYFTTKFQAFGVGMSLYIVHMIITRYFKGNILVKNGKDGAIFEIFLPIQEEQ